MEPLYSGHPWGAKFWPLYRGGLYWGVVLYTNCSFGTWVPGRYIEVAFIQGWPLRGIPLYYLSIPIYPPPPLSFSLQFLQRLVDDHTSLSNYTAYLRAVEMQYNETLNKKPVCGFCVRFLDLKASAEKVMTSLEHLVSAHVHVCFLHILYFWFAVLKTVLLDQSQKA